MCRARLHNHAKPIELKTPFLNGLLTLPPLRRRPLAQSGSARSTWSSPPRSRNSRVRTRRRAPRDPFADPLAWHRQLPCRRNPPLTRTNNDTLQENPYSRSGCRRCGGLTARKAHAAASITDAARAWLRRHRTCVSGSPVCAADAGSPFAARPGMGEAPALVSWITGQSDAISP
jgi:hypothetical protein